MFEEVSYGAALLAGLLSFFSPCILPLVPSYFSFITGTSMEELIGLPTAPIRRRIILSTLAFILGFSTIFIILGASASYLSALLYDLKAYIRIIGGVLIAILGLHLLGVLRIQALDIERHWHLRRKPLHFLGAFVVGLAFGAGWSPCIGPLLGSILILAGNQETVAQGILLLAIYSLGMALPFAALAAGIHFLIPFVRATTRAMRYVNIVAGLLLIATGVLLVSDRLQILSVWMWG
jgi:cytochrome c-type biogenesis protein